MKMKPTLVVLAAGMGSRYGSLKQMDGVGPHREAIIDYSVYDAIRADFGKVVFVIRHSFAEEFMEVFDKKRFGGKIEVEYVYQELDYLPNGFQVPEGRVKPWGTNHAVLMAKDAVDTPFAVINADDFYGKEAYQTIAAYLTSGLKPGEYCMVGYNLKNTLSDYGTVSRGECTVNEAGQLTSMVERTAIARQGDRVFYSDSEGDHEIDENTPVSMNFFGFMPDYFTKSEEMFVEFLQQEKNQTNLKAEYFIPLAVNNLICSGAATMQVLTSEAQWFGVTYKEDRPFVVDRIRSLIDAGVYPENLWGLKD